MECQPASEELSPASASPSEEPLETVVEPSEPVRMKKPRVPRKKKLEAVSETTETTSEEVVQPLLDPLFWAALLNTHKRMLKSKKQDQYSTFRLT